MKSQPEIRLFTIDAKSFNKSLNISGVSASVLDDFCDTAANKKIVLTCARICDIINIVKYTEGKSPR